MKTVLAGENIKTVCAINVSVVFSKEIAYWDNKFYYENPKFWEFWDSVNRKYYMSGNIWKVGYQRADDFEKAEQGKLGGAYCRYLITSHGNEKIDILPTMSFILWHPANKFITTHDYGLNNLIKLMRDCAKYCGGTVEITYSTKQHYFQWDDVPTKTITVGNGIKNYRVHKPEDTEKCPEVNVTYKPKENED